MTTNLQDLIERFETLKRRDSGRNSTAVLDRIARHHGHLPGVATYLNLARKLNSTTSPEAYAAARASLLAAAGAQ